MVTESIFSIELYSMKILFLPKVFPHANVIGGPIIIYNRIKYLSQNNDVSFIAFANEEEKKHLHTIDKYCEEVALLPHPKKMSTTKKWSNLLFSSYPFHFKQQYDLAYQEKLNEMAIKNKYDFIIAEYSMMGQYFYNNCAIPRETKKIISVHECYTLARRMYSKRANDLITKLDEYLRYLQLKTFEFEMYKQADKVLVLTPTGKKELHSFAPELDISVIPHGVDTDFFKPLESLPEKNVLTFLGNYEHKPNIEAVLDFYKNIFPKIRKEREDVYFQIVGFNPPQIIRDLTKDQNVSVVPSPPDVKPHLAKSKIFIAPIKLGGGFRGKVLEAMSMGIPVLSTSLGAQGTHAVPNKDIMIADTDDDFAKSALALLDNNAKLQELSKNGRRLVEEKFSWKVGVGQLENLLREIKKDPH